MRTQLAEKLGVEFPIFAFSHCRDVVAAVSRAGGFGVLGAVAFSPEQLEIELKWIDEHIEGKPYGVDVVMPMKYEGSSKDGGDLTKEAFEALIPEKHKAFVGEILRRYEVPSLPADEKAESLLGWTQSAGRSLVDVALQHPISLLANALGTPPVDVIEKAHRHNVLVASLVGTAEQAIKQVAAGVDVIVAQGTEAGGHTGEVSTMVLVPDVVDAVGPVPVLAAGGIGSGRQMAAAMALGASGVWTGSLWLAVRESDTTPALVEKLLRAKSTDTVRSRALSGKPARQLRTAWTEAWDAKDSPGTLPMPLQYMLCADAHSRIYRYADKEGTRTGELLGGAAGQIIGRMNQVRGARDVVASMVEEYVATVEMLTQLLQS